MSRDYENVQEAVTRANRWIEQEHIRVINVETLLLTGLPESETDTTTAKVGGLSGAANVFQIVRVWYFQDTDALAPNTGETVRLTKTTSKPEPREGAN
jgi:hypothetical protein